MTDSNAIRERLGTSKSAQAAQSLRAYEAKHEAASASPDTTTALDSPDPTALPTSPRITNSIPSLYPAAARASPYLTQAQAAQYLHISERTLERLRHEGGGARYRKAGRRVLYRPQDLDKWLDERAFDNTSEARANGVR